MNKNKIWLGKIVGIILLLVNIAPVYAIDGFSAGIGRGVSETSVVRLGVQWDWAWKWQRLQGSAWQLGGYWEPSFYNMAGKTGFDPQGNSRIAALAFAPVFRLSRTEADTYQPYIEFAVGVAQMNKRTIGDRNLGIHFQFEDRLGFGLKLGKGKHFDLGYKVVHFSNAHIGPQNNGMNMHFIILGYWL